MKKEKITESCSNVFLDISAFRPTKLSSSPCAPTLCANWKFWLRDKQWAQAEATKVLCISQSRVPDLIRGKLGQAQPGHADYISGKSRGKGRAETGGITEKKIMTLTLLTMKLIA